MTQLKALGIGDNAPSAEGRTDEKTPIALSDFHGRALAVFLLGKGFGKPQRTLLSYLAKQTTHFLEIQCSPIIISGEPQEVLSAYQESENLPYVLISDVSMAIHKTITGHKNEDFSSAWLFSEKNKIEAVVPSMGPRELIDAALAARFRLVGVNV